MSPDAPPEKWDQPPEIIAAIRQALAEREARLWYCAECGQPSSMIGHRTRHGSGE